jgi:hypothetical protein
MRWDFWGWTGVTEPCGALPRKCLFIYLFIHLFIYWDDRSALPRQESLVAAMLSGNRYLIIFSQ